MGSVRSDIERLVLVTPPKRSFQIANPAPLYVAIHWHDIDLVLEYLSTM